MVPSSIRSLATLRYSRSSAQCMSSVPAVQKRTKMICSHKNFASDLNELFKGNTEYVANMKKDNPGLLEKLAVEGQSMFCCLLTHLSSSSRSNWNGRVMGGDSRMRLTSFFPFFLEPPFMVVDCSDSRVSEQDIFSAQPGTMFTAGNIANRFDEDDMNSCVFYSSACQFRPNNPCLSASSHPNTNNLIISILFPLFLVPSPCLIAELTHTPQFHPR